jgi:DNA-binding MarR family transcriptional regulator
MDHVDLILAQWHRERPDLDVEPMGILGRMARLIAHLVREKDKVFHKFDLNAAGFDVLATLRRSGPPFRLMPGELMAQTMVTSGTMTNRIDQLEKAGLVERLDHPEDRRAVLIGLTDAGFALIDAAVTAHVANQHRIVATLPAADRAELDRILKAFLGPFEKTDR